MSAPIVRRRKRPVEVATIQWLGDNEADVQAFTGPGVFRAIPADQRTSTPEITASVYDKLHDTWIGVYTGQHIIRGARREHYPIAETAVADDYDIVETDFFQPGHTYTREHHAATIRFLVRYVDNSPEIPYRVAFGWRTEDGDVCASPFDSDDLTGWTDVTGAGEAS